MTPQETHDWYDGHHAVVCKETTMLTRKGEILKPDEVFTISPLAFACTQMSYALQMAASKYQERRREVDNYALNLMGVADLALDAETLPTEDNHFRRKLVRLHLVDLAQEYAYDGMETFREANGLTTDVDNPHVKSLLDQYTYLLTLAVDFEKELKNDL